MGVVEGLRSRGLLIVHSVGARKRRINMVLGIVVLVAQHGTAPTCVVE